MSRYEQQGWLEDLDAALQYHYRAVSLTLNSSPKKPQRLDNLGAAHQARFERLNQQSDLDKAIEYHQQAADMLADGHSSTPGSFNNLGTAYFIRYTHLGQISDLDASITWKLQALSLIPDSHSRKPMILNNLGNSYECRFHRLKLILNLEAAIDYYRQALSLMPDGHSDKPGYLSNLGIACRTRYERLRQLTDLDQAISLQHQAVLLTPNEHPQRPVILDNLSSSYHFSFGHSKQLSDLDFAIQYGNQAISLLPESHPGIPQIQSSLGNLYSARHKNYGNIEDLNAAIDFKRSAILSTLDNYLDKPTMLVYLGQFLENRFRLTEDTGDLTQSRDCFKQAAQSPAGISHIRSRAAFQWGRLSVVCDKPQVSLEASQYFTSLIPEVVWHGMAMNSRYEEAPRIANLCLEVVTAAVVSQSFERALEWLEQGQSIVWNQILQLRTPFDALHEVNMSLAKELTDTAYELQSVASLDPSWSDSSDPQSSSEELSQRHRRLAERWDWLISQVQLLPSMKDFMTPKKATDLINSAHGGAVVVVIVHDRICSALILHSTRQPRLSRVHLENLSRSKLAYACRQLSHNGEEQGCMNRGIKKAIRTDTSRYLSVLGMLWADIAKPVLDDLGYTEPLPAAQLPRITWCTTGPLSFLPLHAAGDYRKPSHLLFHYAISSYTPTLSTLLQHRPVHPTFSGIAMIGQELTVNLPPLPGTKSELDMISQRAGRIHVTRIEADRATCSTVLEAIQQHSWVHLACHASQDLVNPVASSFHLHDGSLDLAAITRRHLPQADLAFLSACETATGDQDLSEEAVHLAAGMVVAGYRSVIATMWPIHDEDAPLVADRFYEYMLKDEIPDSRNAARALHYALGCLREKVGAEAFMRWAPFIHVGN
ncbi:hypothetical protein FRC07_001620 [Ceratobasidium sp. 392]|nr:hypothetical protein FRC07_001620 [Ceratobasidium sp. 392]